MMTEKEILGKNVRRIRRALDITQTELGSQIGKNTVWISNIETGRSGIMGVDLIELANALNTTAEVLFKE